MKWQLATTFLVLTQMSSWSTPAWGVDVCETHASIVARADDEVCDYHVEAAKACFDKLILRYTFLKHRRDRTPASEIIAEAIPLKGHYEQGITTLRENVSMLDPEGCGDQREGITVLIEELERDLKNINNRIQVLKKPPAPVKEEES